MLGVSSLFRCFVPNSQIPVDPPKDLQKDTQPPVDPEMVTANEAKEITMSFHNALREGTDLPIDQNTMIHAKELFKMLLVPKIRTAAGSGEFAIVYNGDSGYSPLDRAIKKCATEYGYKVDHSMCDRKDIFISWGSKLTDIPD